MSDQPIVEPSFPSILPTSSGKNDPRLWVNCKVPEKIGGNLIDIKFVDKVTYDKTENPAIGDPNIF